MEKAKSRMVTKIAVLITYFSMVIVNALANILPINGVNTGQVSDSYPNLFAPAGFTFSIWGVIYLLLACYTFYHLGIFNKGMDERKTALMKDVGNHFGLYWDQEHRKNCPDAVLSRKVIFPAATQLALKGELDQNLSQQAVCF